MSEQTVRHMIASISCNSCGNHYGPRSVEVLGHRDTIWFVRVICASCHLTVYIIAIIRDERPQIYTDLTEDDLTRFRDMEPVNDDDLMNVRDFLKDFSGDFQDLFRG